MTLESVVYGATSFLAKLIDFVIVSIYLKVGILLLTKKTQELWQDQDEKDDTIKPKSLSKSQNFIDGFQFIYLSSNNLENIHS